MVGLDRAAPVVDEPPARDATWLTPPMLAVAIEAVQEVFLSTRAFYSDLLDDLHVTDSIAIDGDSLLLELSADVRIDWGGQSCGQG